jgi:hypothetical protein
VVVRSVCPDTGLPATANCPSPTPELFLAGHVPAERCDLHSGGLRYRDRRRDHDWSQEKEEERRLDPRRP